jgi:hypothetical protein
MNASRWAPQGHRVSYDISFIPMATVAPEPLSSYNNRVMRRSWRVLCNRLLNAKLDERAERMYEFKEFR